MNKSDPGVNLYIQGSVKLVGWIYNLGFTKLNIFDTKVIAAMRVYSPLRSIEVRNSSF